MADRRPKTKRRSDPKANSGRSETLRIKLLGDFQVTVGSRVIGHNEWRLRKSASLVKLLALAPGHRLHRDQVMDTLWADLGIRAASNNLRQTVHNARRTLGLDSAAGSRYLASEEGSLVLRPGGGLWVDVEAFEQATRAARRSREPAAYRAALDLYAGDLLPQDRYEDWAEGRREVLRRTFLSLMDELAELYDERGQYGRAIEILRKAVAEQPTNEEAHVRLLRFYALSGKRAKALDQYERLEDILSTERATAPGAEARELREEIAAGRFPPTHRPSPFGSSPEQPADAPRYNLPAPRDSFVGRQHEMLDVKRALAMTRLLTLTGAGGSGKTRLALEVARDLAWVYPEGVWLVELAGLSDSELVPQVVAAALEIQERPGQSLTDTLTDALRGKHMLLILDNCEHLLDDAAHLVNALLDRCSKLHILATSREALAVTSEIRWPVSGLSVPDPRGTGTVGELERSESARLFAERASERRPGFSLTPSNAQAVAQICRKLEGVPLAIELAAARVGTLSIEQISQRLTDSLRLLTGGSKTQMPKQRTLRGALDWSYELLSEDERKLFGRLSVFAGGWTLEAAETVGVGGGLEEDDIMDLLSGLVEKSLVVAESAQRDSVRFRMLEPVRQYANERLEEGGEGEEIRRRHAGYFLALAEEAEPGCGARGRKVARPPRRRARQPESCALADAGARRGRAGLRLAGALWPFWEARGYYDEGRTWLEEALEEEGRASAAVRAKALKAVGWLAHAQIDLDRAEAAAREGLTLSAEAELGGSLAASFQRMLGVAARSRGDYERAKALFEESLPLSREADDKLGTVNSILELGATFDGPG